MKMKKTILCVFVAIVLGLLAAACRNDTDSAENLKDIDAVKSVAKFIGYNVDKNSELKGIAKITLTASQPLQSKHKAAYVMEEGNTKRSEYDTFGSPHPIYWKYFDFWEPFADGSFPEAKAFSGVVRPVKATGKITEFYGKDGKLPAEKTPSEKYRKWSVDWNAAGVPTMTEVSVDSSGDSYPLFNDAYSLVWKFVTDNTVEFDGQNRQNYRLTEILYRDQTGDTIARGTYAKSNNASGGIDRTDACYDGEGKLSTSYCGFDSKNVIAKKTETEVYSGNDSTEIISYYDASDDEFSREVKSSTFYSRQLPIPKSSITKGYTVSAGTATLSWQGDYDEYDSAGRIVKRTEYNVTDGTADVDYYLMFSYDGSGNNTLMKVLNASEDILAEYQYVYDSNGLKTSERRYGYTDKKKDATPSCYNKSGNADTTHTFSADGSYTKEEISYCKQSDGTYYEEPVSKTVTKWNEKRLVVSSESHNWDSTREKWVLQFKGNTNEYNADGTVKRKTTYIVSDEKATANGYYEYEYDQNLFQVAEKKYNADGVLINDDNEQPCTADEYCYKKTVYSYK